jgi:hypothetical protein
MGSETVRFSNYDKLPLSKEQMLQRLSQLLGRSIWKEGTPFSEEIRLPERKVSRKPSRFANDLQDVFGGIAAEVTKRGVPSDYLLEVILYDESDNNQNQYRDWLFIRVRLLRA